MEPLEPSRRDLIWTWALILGGPLAVLTAYFKVPLGVFGPEHPEASWVTFGAALALIAALLLREVRKEMLGAPGRLGAVILVLSCLSLVVFASSYFALSREPGQFSGLQTRLDALYFTVITLATVGYGDIYPSGQEARVVVMFQILYSLVFLTAGATALSRHVRSRVAERAARRGH